MHHCYLQAHKQAPKPGTAGLCSANAGLYPRQED